MKYTITEIKAEETKLEFEILPPLYVPFHCVNYDNAHYFYKPFDFEPFKMWALTCSGSPVILAHRFFVGFLNENGGRYIYDGADKLTVVVPAGQEVFCAEGDPFEAWKAYNDVFLGRRNDPVYPVQDFWKGLEYCTWNDQKYEANSRPKYRNSFGCANVLDEEYVYNYMRRIEKLGMPHGKITIDEGWDAGAVPENGAYEMGNFDIDRRRFPHWEQLLRDMTVSGFKPAIWYCPFLVTANSRIGTEHPELMSSNYMYQCGDNLGRRFLLDSDILDSYYRETMGKYISMGVRKFKCDLSYGPREQMRPLLRRVYRIAKELDPTVEIEAHMPDIFASRYCDVVRTNDVSFDIGDWRSAVYEHYRVSHFSTPDRILNIDHLGTNCEEAPQRKVVEHAHMVLQLKGGYPVVSLLPDRLSPYHCEQFTEMVKNWKYEEPSF